LTLLKRKIAKEGFPNDKNKNDPNSTIKKLDGLYPTVNDRNFNWHSPSVDCLTDYWHRGHWPLCKIISWEADVKNLGTNELKGTLWILKEKN